MTRVSFYFNAPNKADVARKLATKAFQAGQCSLLFTEDAALVSELDMALWTSTQLSFIPHVRCAHPLAKQTPILIGGDPDRLASPDVLINLSDAWPPFFSRFERLIELVSLDETDRLAGRQRYRFYQERGYALDAVDLAKEGR